MGDLRHFIISGYRKSAHQLALGALVTPDAGFSLAGYQIQVVLSSAKNRISESGGHRPRRGDRDRLPQSEHRSGPHHFSSRRVPVDSRTNPKRSHRHLSGQTAAQGTPSARPRPGRQDRRFTSKNRDPGTGIGRIVLPRQLPNGHRTIGPVSSTPGPISPPSAIASYWPRAWITS